MAFEKATEARIKMGKDTDQELLDYLKKNPDKTIYELHKDLDWSTGKVQKAIRRLDNKLEVTRKVGEGRIRKKYRVLFKEV